MVACPYNGKVPGYSGKSFTTHNVYINNINGYRYHVADHNDGCRIVTALDGPMAGYQGMAFNGIQIAESTGLSKNLCK